MPEDRRVYPAGTATAIVGTTDIDGNGLAGLEESYESSCSGKDGHQVFIQSAAPRRRPLALSPITLDAPHDGARLELALDMEIQAADEKLAQSTLEKTGAETVTILQSTPAPAACCRWRRRPAPARRRTARRAPTRSSSAPSPTSTSPARPSSR